MIGAEAYIEVTLTSNKISTLDVKKVFDLAYRSGLIFNTSGQKTKQKCVGLGAKIFEWRTQKIYGVGVLMWLFPVSIALIFATTLESLQKRFHNVQRSNGSNV